MVTLERIREGGNELAVILPVTQATLIKPQPDSPDSTGINVFV